MLNSNDSQIKASVIVPIYNGENDLPDLIRCLQLQTYPRNQIEYILVDNNSNDRTAKILKASVIEGAKKGLLFKALQKSQIQSSYAARNQGIKAARGEILAFTDADCRPFPDWIEKLIQPFTNPDIGIVVGGLIALPGNSLLEKYAERTKMMSPHFLLEHPFGAFGQTANLAICKKAFKQIGLFRPYLTTGGDADICWRIQRETGFKLTFSGEAIIRHRHRSTLPELISQWQRYGRSHLYLHELHGVDLMEDLTFKTSLYCLSRWLFKDLPRDSFQLIQGKVPVIDLIKTPIELIISQARNSGQREAILPEKARQIEWLD